MTFGSRLRQIRMSVGMSQQELANRMGLKNRASITHIEKGRSNPTTEVVAQLAKILGVDPSDFFTTSDEAEIEDIILALKKSDEATRMIIRRILGIEKEKK